MENLLNFNVVGEPVFDSKGNEIPKKKLLRREDTNEVLSVVSSKYQIIQNSDLLPNVPTNFELIATRIEHGGRKVRGTFIDKANEFEIGGQKLNPMIIYSNSFDGSTPWTFEGGLHRLICTNGLIHKGIDFIKIRSRRHTGSQVGILEMDFTKIPEIIEIFKKAAEVPLTYLQAQSFLEKLVNEEKLSTKSANNVINLFEYKSDIKSNTVFGFYNAVSDLASNSARSIHQQDQLNDIANLVLKMAA